MPRIGSQPNRPNGEFGLARKFASPVTGDRLPDLKSVFSTSELARRPSRAPDYISENRALIALTKEMASSPEGILQKLADTALLLCRAHSAGLSLLDEGDGKKNFHWRAIAGAWTRHLGGGTPRDFGPCGAVLDFAVPLMFSHPEHDFPYFDKVEPLLEEGLMIPLYIKGEGVGTIWVAAHDRSRRFDAEDLRLLTGLGAFAAAAYQTLLSLNAAERTTSIVESSDDAIVSKDLYGVITTWNRAAKRLFGYTAEEIIGQHISILIPANRRDEERTIIERISRGERIDHYETVRKRKDGSLVPISLTLSPIRTADGKIIGASKIARDITARKQEEEHIARLSHEVDHRSKNLLSVVQAIVRLTESDTPHALKTAIVGRIQALANVQGLLGQSRWAGADIRSLIAAELAPYCPDGEPRADIVGPDLLLKPALAQSIAIVLHELTTNAAKYGALSAYAGSLRIEWSREEDGGLTILWTEVDGPPVQPPSRKGFGTRVIEQTLQADLKGKAYFDWRQDGLVCRLELGVFDA